MMCTTVAHIEEVLPCSGSAIEPTSLINELPHKSFQMVSSGDILDF